MEEQDVLFQVALGWGHQEKAAAHNIDQGGWISGYKGENPLLVVHSLALANVLSSS